MAFNLQEGATETEGGSDEYQFTVAKTGFSGADAEK